jgi:alpha-tubulin suppressor-like RCC1 family protein
VPAGGNGATATFQFAFDAGVTSLSLGSSFGCGWSAGGTAWCWGDDTFGQIGNTGAGGIVPTPIQVQGLDAGVLQLSAGLSFACAIGQGGQPWCWGDNRKGELGGGLTASTSPLPVPVSGLGPCSQISAGYEHACAVTQAGQVWCWGDNTYGELGNGQDGGTSNVPLPVTGLDGGVVAVGASWDFTCALTQAGQIWCWGNNFNGDLGNGTRGDRTLPTLIQ